MYGQQDEKIDVLAVIIPAYNAEQYLVEAITSVTEQCPELKKEIIVVDDGSEDGTAELAETFADVVIRKERGGAASAKNVGLSASSGNLILFLDADDILTNGSISIMYAALRSGADAVFAKAEDFISDELAEEERQKLAPREGSYGGVLPGCSILRREVFDRIGSFDSTLNGGETVEWMMRLRDSGIRSIQLNWVSLKRRIHRNNTGRVLREQELRNYARLLRNRNQ